jgi:hypothetical protein
MHAIPENFRLIWAASDQLISWAEIKIAESSHLVGHLSLIEIYMSGVQVVQRTKIKSDRHTALAGLFMRTFDALSHSVRAATSGNYSGAAMYARDLLETHFLIDFLLDEVGRPEKWLHATPKQIKGEFSPSNIRRKLDERDGFTTEQRKQHYDLLSTLGAHPTPFALDLKRDGTRSINSGPFKHEELLRELIEEFAKICLVLSTNIVKYLAELENSAEAIAAISLTLQKNQSLYFGKP